MARDRRDIVDEESTADAAALSKASPPNKPLAENYQTAQPRDQLLTLVRALARNAARADHAAERGNL